MLVSMVLLGVLRRALVSRLLVIAVVLAERLVVLIDGLDEYDPPAGSVGLDPLAAYAAMASRAPLAAPADTTSPARRRLVIRGSAAAPRRRVIEPTIGLA